MIAGLTGGIGSGKSTVARLFEVLGCAVFNSDEAAREAYHVSGIREKIESLLGPGAYLEGQAIDRKFISNRVFTDNTLLLKLNSVIHPVVGEMFHAFKTKNKGKIIIKESALLYEANVTAGLDKIIVVAAPDEIRIQRVMRRDGASLEEVKARLASQLPQNEKTGKADFVIHNDDAQLIIPQVNRIFTLLAHDQERLPGKRI
jgi:dephospho-CoA kinase